jgi:replicative DNA helicase
MVPGSVPTADPARNPEPDPPATLRGGRDLPHNVDAEQAVLGALLIDDTAFDLVAPVVRAEDFYVLAHQHVFAACIELVQERRALDPVLLAQRLDAKGLLGHAVPHELPFALAHGLGTAGNVLHYAKVVQELARLRRMMLAAQGIVARGFEAGANVQEFLDSSSQEIFGAAQGTADETLQRIEHPMFRAVEAIEAVQKRVQEGKSPITGVPTGIHGLDQKLLGLQPGALVVLAARPSVGKTAFALNIATHAAIRAERTVGVFSLEMPGEQLSTRMLAAEAKLDWRRMSQGTLQRNDWDKIMQHADKISRAKIWLDDNFVLTPIELRSKCRKVKREQNGLDLVVVDYLQLMHSPGASSREQEIATISRSLKQLAKELECPVLALSQLNRAVEKRKGDPPMLSDLRESGAIEQDADVVMFLHRPGDGDQEGVPQTPGDVQDVELHIAKQRQGPTGVVELVFFKNHTYFAEKQRGS